MIFADRRVRRLHKIVLCIINSKVHYYYFFTRNMFFAITIFFASCFACPAVVKQCVGHTHSLSKAQRHNLIAIIFQIGIWHAIKSSNSRRRNMAVKSETVHRKKIIIFSAIMCRHIESRWPDSRTLYSNLKWLISSAHIGSVCITCQSSHKWAYWCGETRKREKACNCKYLG